MSQWSELNHRRFGDECNAVVFTILCCEQRIVAESAAEEDAGVGAPDSAARASGDDCSSSASEQIATLPTNPASAPAATAPYRRSNILPIELWLQILSLLRGYDFGNEGRQVEGPKVSVPGADRFSLFGNKGLCYGSYYG